MANEANSIEIKIIGDESDYLRALKNAHSQTKESTKSIQSVVSSATSKVNSVIGTIGKTAIAAGATAVGAFASIATAAVKSYADYEQLTGGVEKLFGESADTITQYAHEAVTTAGMSANEYLETVTSFAASLIKSVGGDTAKAAEYADMAVRDMSDNVNVFGSDMESLQNAYSGFARENYTMLDNLKLGYAGTKEGMKQLLDDANEYNRQQGKNTEYQLGNYADIVAAIHDIQIAQNIEGTTAKEASSTISGSINAAKKAWENFILALGTGQNTKEALDTFTSYAKQAFKNVIPVVKQVWASILEIIREYNPELADVLDTLAQKAGDMFVDLVKSIPEVVKVLKEVGTWVTKITKFMSEHGKTVLTVVTVVASLVAGLNILNVAFKVIGAIVPVIGTIMTGLCSPIGLVIAAVAAAAVGVTLLIANWEKVKAAASRIWNNVKTTVTNACNDLKYNVSTAWNGIQQKTSNAWNAVKTTISGTWTNVKSTVSSGISAVGSSISTGWNNVKTGASEAWNTFSGYAQSALQKVQNLNWSNVASNIATAWDSLKEKTNSVWKSITSSTSQLGQTLIDKFGGAISKITKMFSGMHISIPKVKLPHIAVEWKSVGNYFKIPKLKINWYAQGGVFDTPTAFNYGNTLNGLGENGAEAVVPLEKNTEWLDKIAERLGGNNKPIYLMVDGKVFAQTAISAINQNTKQTGKLQLKLS